MFVIGPKLSAANTNKAYYRVVAVDGAGSESGPSDHAEAPRPLVWNRPEATAKAGKPYRWQAQVIRSEGDLRCRPTRESSYNAAFWDREACRFSAIRLPEGWTIDQATGLVAGTPVKPGVLEIAFKVQTGSGKGREVSCRLVVEQ